jgi:Fe-S cluster assembly protein SufD
MTFENNFKHHSSEYIFSHDNFLVKQRESFFDKIRSNKFDRKNNESLKNLSISDLSNFNYHYHPVKEEPEVLLLEKESYKIKIVNGKCKNFEDDNIEIKNISRSDFKVFNNQNNENLNDIVLDLNSIFLNTGIFFNIKKNTKLKLYLSHNTHDDFTVFQNSFFNYENNCEVIIEDEFNFSKNTLNNINYNIHISENSKVEHNIFQNFSNSNKLYLSSNAVCKKKSSFIQNTYNFAEGLVRNFHFAKLEGKFSKASLKGCFFLKDKNICSNKTYITHKAENCESTQIYKGILNDFSKANYFSNTFVSKNAQKTEGYQLSKGILLTDSCSFFSKPELRIYADDVKCSHGSTIGPVDESALYYLRSRGINKNQAMKMIISSFIEEDLKYLNIKNTSKILESLSKYLENIL